MTRAGGVVRSTGGHLGGSRLTVRLEMVRGTTVTGSLPTLDQELDDPGGETPEGEPAELVRPRGAQDVEAHLGVPDGATLRIEHPALEAHGGAELHGDQETLHGSVELAALGRDPEVS